MRRIIGVMSGKGGVGKTVSALNLSMAVHQQGESSMLVDADLNNPNIGLHLGIYNFPTALNDVLEQEQSIMEALHIHPSGLRIIPSSISLHYLHTSPYHLESSLQSLDGFVFVDCAPGFGREVINTLEACDEIIAVTNPIFPSVVGCMRLIEVAKEMNTPIRGIVVNNLGTREVSDEEIGSICGVPVLGTVPYDRTVDASIMAKQPLVSHAPYSRAAEALQHVASDISGIEHKSPRFRRMRHLLSSMQNMPLLDNNR